MSASSWHTLTSLTALSSLTSKRRRILPSPPHSLTAPRCSSSLTGFREISAEPKQPQADATSFTEALKKQNDVASRNNEDDEDEEDQAISKVPVPRQKYIPVSKAELLDGVVSKLFPDDDGDLEQFLLLSK